jgi:hypothetical protein
MIYLIVQWGIKMIYLIVQWGIKMIYLHNCSMGGIQYLLI